MAYCIGSFNLRDLSYSNQSTDNSSEKLNRNFEMIAQIIFNENLDAVALQEINAENALKYLTSILNKKYKSIMREYNYSFGFEMPMKKGGHDPERYGFIWNTKRLRLIDVTKGMNPGYYKNAGALELIRPPYYARFTARGMFGGSNFELRIVNTHILSNNFSEAERIREFDILVKNVLPRICDHREISQKGEIMPAYTFLMGDYNLELKKSKRAIYRIETITQTNYTGKNRFFKTVQEQNTSLKLPNAQQNVEECYAHNFDHFTYETDLENKQIVLTPQRIEALSKYYKNFNTPVEKLKEYRTEISDHVPIKLTINF